MGFSWDTALGAVEVAIYTALPEVRSDNGGGGVWEADRLARIDFESLPGVPYVAVAWGEVRRVPMPITARAFVAPLHILYVTDLTGAAGIAKVRFALDALQTYLLVTGLTGTTASILDVEGYNWSVTQEVNQKLIDLGLPLVAGALTAELYGGE